MFSCCCCCFCSCSRVSATVWKAVLVNRKWVRGIVANNQSSMLSIEPLNDWCRKHPSVAFIEWTVLTMNEANSDAPALVRRRRRIARQQREKTPEPISKVGGIKPKFSDDESSSTTTTPNEFERRRSNTVTVPDSIRIRPKTASVSSGDGSRNYSNVAYRDKILNRRDRSQRPTQFARSQSQPRELVPDSPTPELKAPSNSSGNVIRFLRQAKRSLSIPR